MRGTDSRALGGPTSRNVLISREVLAAGVAPALTGLCLLAGVAGCAAPNLVEQAEQDAQASQVRLREDELHQLATSRAERLVDYETTIRRQEERYAALVGENRTLRRDIDTGAAEVAQLQATLRETVASRDAAGAEVGRARTELAALQTERTQLSGASDAQRAEIARLQAQSAELETQLAASRAEGQRLADERAAAETQLASRRGELAALAGQRGQLEAEGARAEQERARLEQDVAARRAALAQLQAERDAQYARVASLEVERATLAERRDLLEGGIHDGEADLARLEERMSILRERTQSARARKDTLELELARVEVEREQSQQSLERLRRERADAEQALSRASELRRRALHIGEEVARLEQELADLGTSQEVIRQTRDEVLARLRTGPSTAPNLPPATAPPPATTE